MSDDLIEELRRVQELADYRSYATDVIGKAIRTIEELETVLADVVGWLDRTGRKGCAHTEHARRALGGDR